MNADFANTCLRVMAIRKAGWRMKRQGQSRRGVQFAALSPSGKIVQGAPAHDPRRTFKNCLRAIEEE